MRLAAAAVVALPVLAALSADAVARPGALAGVGLGRIEAEQDWDGEADSTLQLFGRLGLTSRIGAQLELQAIEGTTGSKVRTGTALLVVELGTSGRLVPTVFAGVGLARGDDGYGYEQRGRHIEGGFGLEYRLDGGLSLMADIRLGGRSIDDQAVILDGPQRDVAALYAPVMIEGEYRSARAGVAVRF